MKKRTSPSNELNDLRPFRLRSVSTRELGERGESSHPPPGLASARARRSLDDLAFDGAPAPDHHVGFGSGAPPDIAPERLAELAHRIYKARRLRAAFLNNSLFGEPVWDMLLALYCQNAAGEPLSISGLCYSADVPATTALRWSSLLEQKNLIVRTRDLRDARRAHVKLSDHGHALMSAYLATIFEKYLLSNDPQK